METIKIRKRSLIKKYFSDELYLELLKVTFIPNSTNDEKVSLIKKLLTDYNVPFTGLGAGTNRMGVLIDGYAVKIALDVDGKIDNLREMKYTKVLQPYVIKVYECVPDGLIAFTEFVEYFTLDDFHRNQDAMSEILSIISENYLIGDVGLTTKNYANWGRRMDNTICILDFAYIYDVSYNTFKCGCEDESLLRYDAKYVNLICPTCGRKYTFGEIRRRISRKQQENEIGDIRNVGYNIHYDNEEVELVPEFEPVKEEKKKKKKSPEKENLKRIKNERKEERQMKHVNDLDYITPEDQIKNLEELDSIIFGTKKPTKVTQVSNISKKNMSSSINSQLNTLLNYGGADESEEEDNESPKSILDVIMKQEKDIIKNNNKETNKAMSEIDDMVFDVNGNEDDISYASDIDDIEEYETSITEDVNNTVIEEAADIIDSEDTTNVDYEEYDEFDYDFDMITSRGIQFLIPELSLGKLVVNDGISPTSFSMVYGNNYHYKPETEIIGAYDPDDCIDRMEQILDYIISFKHPTAIYTLEEFEQTFTGVTDYDDRKFRFYKVDNYILAYHVDMDTIQNFYDVMNDNDFSINKILGTMVGISYAVSNLNNAFFSDDESYVEKLSESESNLMTSFNNVFLNIENTEKDVDSDSLPATIDVRDLHNLVRVLIGTMTGTNPYSEDDEFDEDDDEDYSEFDYGEDDESDNNEVEVNDSDVETETEDTNESDDETETSNNESDIIDDLLAEEMEAIEPDDHMYVDVHRKNFNNQ